MILKTETMIIEIDFYKKNEPMIKNVLMAPAICAMIMAFLPVKWTPTEIAFISLAYVMLGLNHLCKEINNLADELKKKQP